MPRSPDREQASSANTPPLVMAAEVMGAAMPLQHQQTPMVSTPKSAVAIPKSTSAPIESDISWRQQFYVYSAVLAIFTIVWIADGMFTVLGLLMSGIPATVLGFILACGFHLLASWGQRSLIFDPLPLLKAVGLGLLGINVLSNIVGIRLAFAALAPRLAGTLPLHPGEWLLALLDWAGGTLNGKEAAMPTWWPTALIIALLGGSLAWFAEKLLAQVHARWKVICEQRPR